MTAIYSFSVRKTNKQLASTPPTTFLVSVCFIWSGWHLLLRQPFYERETSSTERWWVLAEYATILSFSGVQLFYGQALCFSKLNSTTGCSYLLLRWVVSTICRVCDISLDPFRNRHASPQGQVSTSRTHSILLRLFNLHHVAPSSN